MNFADKILVILIIVGIIAFKLSSKVRYVSYMRECREAGEKKLNSYNMSKRRRIDRSEVVKKMAEKGLKVK